MQPACIIGAKKAEPQSVTRCMQQLQALSTKVPEHERTLIAKFEAVWVAWKGLDINDVTWEALLCPLFDADDYLQWHKGFRAWQQAEQVSMSKRPMGRIEHTKQLAKVSGGALKLYQVDSTQWLVQKWSQGKSAVLSDEMGMGKTIQSIAFLLTAYQSMIDQSLSNDVHDNSGMFPFLVVVLKTLVLNWAREFQVWRPEVVVAELSGDSANVEPELPTEHERYMRLIDARGKLKLLHVLLPELKSRGHRVLLFAQFKDTLILEDILGGESIGCVRIEGNIPAADRQSGVIAFNNPQSTDMCFGIDAYWRTGPKLNIGRSMARAHRIGQTKPVYVFKLVTQDMVEERINKHVEHSRVEQALRLGASWVFGEDAQADECTIVYNVEKVRALLDQCKRVVEAEQKAISAPEDFSPVWVADLDGEMHELEDTAEDTVSDVWVQLLSQADQLASVVQLPSEDVNGRLLRVCKHKVDYVADDTKRKSGPVDAEFVPDEIELMELHIVAKGDLLSMHRKRLVASYSHAPNEQTAKQAREAKAMFAALANGRRVQPGVIPGREMRTKNAAASKQRSVYERAKIEQRDQVVYAAFYESFTANNFEPDPPVDLPVERKQPVRSYMLALLNSSAYTKFCNMLAGSQVDVCKASDVDWLRKRLKWLCGYRVKLVQSWRAVVKRHEFVSAGDQAMGLRFISMRVKQVRARIDELHSKAVESKQPSELTTADLQTYVTKLRDLLYLVSQSTKVQLVHIVTQYIEQTRNYCVGVLARLGAPGQGVKAARKLVREHDMAVAGQRIQRVRVWRLIEP
ncbi:hypothetical protein IW148_003964 [Coemansia sp. RSA 1199]|nr:hypothetical protein IW148_003964 [Coemansia sp. RSA 1199]